MKFSNRYFFFIAFWGVFSGVLVLLGVSQAIVGTLRLYNDQEELHEKLNQDKTHTYVVSEPKPSPSIFMGMEQSKTESAETYFSSNKNDIQEAIKTVSPEKAQKIIVRVAQAEETIKTETKIYTPPVQQEPVQLQQHEEEFHTPVELQIVPETFSPPKGYTDTVNTVIEGKYFRDTLWSFPILVDGDRVSPRWQMSNESVTLSGKIASLSEMSKVLVHELGHMVDIYVLRQRSLSTDPSKLFYAISWSEPTVIKTGVPTSSFISGYSATNQYEDFAESFAFYVFHNRAFQDRAAKNSLLQQKYDFLHTYVFGDSFQGTAYEKDVIPSKLWDVTKIVIKTNTLSSIFVAMKNLFSQTVL